MNLKLICQSVCIVAATCVQSAPAQNRVPLADDGYHLKYWEGSPYNAAYTEWWYFNLYDAKKDIQAIFSYQVVNPLSLGGPSVSYVAALAYKGNEIIPGIDFYPSSLFSASYSEANVAVGPNRITVLGDNRYAISGSSTNGRLTWNLTYEREAASWFAGDHVNVGPAAWEQMSWLLYMPRAHVCGTLTIDGQSFQIESSGYHDHNWGEWDFSTVDWNWAQYSQPGLTFDLGDFVGNPNGRASLDVWGHRVVFTAAEYKLVHTKWAVDPVTNLQYPIESVFTAQNSDVKLEVVMDTNKSAPLTAGPPPALVIFEQPAHFKGEITMYSDWFPVKIPFEGNGFKEYTATSGAAQ